MIKKEKLTTDGFSPIEVIFVLIILVVIGSVGYFVIKHDMSKTKTAKTSASLSSNTKQFCDNPVSFCLNYPDNWTAVKHASASVGTIEGIVNPSATVGMAYFDTTPAVSINSFQTTNPTVVSSPDPSINVSFVSSSILEVVSVSDTKSNNYEVVGAYVSNANDHIPFYLIVPDTEAQSNALYANKEGVLQLPVNLVSKQQSSNTVAMLGAPISDTPYTTSQAKAWFNTTDAKSLQDVMSSFEVK
jgi:hypothetical protein